MNSNTQKQQFNRQRSVYTPMHAPYYYNYGNYYYSQHPHLRTRQLAQQHLRKMHSIDNRMAPQYSHAPVHTVSNTKDTKNAESSNAMTVCKNSGKCEDAFDINIPEPNENFQNNFSDEPLWSQQLNDKVQDITKKIKSTTRLLCEKADEMERLAQEQADIESSTFKISTL